MQEHQIFKLVKSDHEECGTLLAACVGLVLLLAALIAPFVPSLTHKVAPLHLACSSLHPALWLALAELMPRSCAMLALQGQAAVLAR